MESCRGIKERFEEECKRILHRRNRVEDQVRDVREGKDETVVELLAAPQKRMKQPIRPCLKIGGMPDRGGFFRQARRFFAGIPANFKENQRGPGGKRRLETAL